jgi:hypothetical protein
VSRISIRKAAVAGTAAMSAAGAIVGINLGTNELSQAEATRTGQASVIQLGDDRARETEALRESQEAAAAAAQRQAAARQAAQRQAVLAAQARQRAAAQRLAQAKTAKAKADARKAAAEEAAREAQRKKEAEEASRAEDRKPVKTDPDSNKALGRKLAADRGWGDSEFSCLEKLWDKESRWKHTAKNPSSGAYGIPQSLPGDKMASVGPDWETNPETQIKWGLGYIKDRYGSPCEAWGHSQTHGWY